MSKTTATVTATIDPAADIVAKVAAYVAAKPSVRVGIIAALNVRLGATFGRMSEPDVDVAAVQTDGQHLVDIIAACNASTAKVAPVRVETDFRLVVSQRVADLRLAADLLEQGVVTPDAIPSDQTPDVDCSPFGLTLPYAAGDMVNATKLAGTKVTRSTESNVIADVIAAAFADLPSGSYLTSTEIGIKGGHSRGGKANGAVNAALYPQSGKSSKITGVTPAPKGEKQGAYKV